VRYFLTGATGFLGGRIARMLREDGHEVVALVRDIGRVDHLRDLGIELAHGDIRARESLPDPMQGCDGVFHVAGWYKINDPNWREAFQTNVDGTRNVLEVMRDLGIPRGVYTSTLAVNGDTHGALLDESYIPPKGPFLSVYDHSKWAGHYEVAEPMMREGLPLIILQPGLIYGPGDPSGVGQAIRAFLQRKLSTLPAGFAVCWGHIDDTARVHIQAMERGVPGQNYYVPGPPHSLVDAFKLAVKLTTLPGPRFIAPTWLTRVLGRFSEEIRVTAGVTYLGDNSRARRELGFDPRPLEVGLKETLDAEAAAIAEITEAAKRKKR
jgi:nucleoside-diphosphate-sugar epimerase